ncbi:hypothetical protein WJX81_004256 [Elliptochloris bilobata]|uniref:Uncharacterized protein n=1 Tax=Elliptochloris bilobata TaxID=381761 RepID=A0AAW1QN02_9CHLO
MGAKSQQELAKLVAENLLAFDPKFWLRMATRADAAESREEKDRLTALANTVMTIVDTIVARTNTQVADSSKVLQAIMAAAANEHGEWELPLSTEKADAMRREVAKHEGALDEALLSNAFAWMRKAADDRLDGMVALLQKVLQLYAGHALSKGSGGTGRQAEGEGGAAEEAVQRLLAADEDRWDALLSEAVASEVSEAALVGALRRRMEKTVLVLPSGSYAQRVQAEYLSELEARATKAFQNANQVT